VHLGKLPAAEPEWLTSHRPLQSLGYVRDFAVNGLCAVIGAYEGKRFWPVCISWCG